MDVIKDVKGKKLKSYGSIKIFEGFPHNFYEVSRPTFTEKEKELADSLIKVILRESAIGNLKLVLSSPTLIEDFRNLVVHPIDMNNLIQRLPSVKQFAEIENSLIDVVKKLKVQNPKELVDYVLSKTIGYREISEMMEDDGLEEIMINGSNRNVFVFHRLYGMCKTDLVVDEHSFVFDLIMRIAQTVKKQFNEQHPLLDARLPDGSRVNATFVYVTPFGHSLTIRKFSKVPLSIIHLIESETISMELASFLWAMIEGLGVEPMNIIVTGGSGSGKTTLMNVLSSFIPYSSRILTIEDTLELDLGDRSNWIQMESKPGIRDIAEVAMDDLLKNSLRMRPDRILVGEVRGKEAQTLFVAMDTGHRGILGTLHSNTAREMILRLKSSPMSVAESMLPLLDLAVVMQRTYNPKVGMLRKVKQVAEVARMDEKVLLSNIFELNPKKDMIEKTDIPSGVVEKLADRAGMTKRELKREILVRKKIIEWMIKNGIKERPSVEKVIQQYYYDPKSLLQRVTEEL